MNIGQLILQGLIPAITLANPEAGKEISNIEAAVSNPNEENIVQVIEGGFATAKSLFPTDSPWVPVLTDAEDILTEVHTVLEPKVGKLLTDIKAIQAPKNA